MSGRIDEYQKETVEAYQDGSKALAYDRQHSNGLTWARFTMWREINAVKRALRELGLDQGRFLDVPCGTGVAAQSFNSVDGLVTAVDISREMMNLARGRYDTETFQGLLQGDIAALPFSDGAFDATVTLGFMHRVPERIKRAAMRELIRVTRGVLVISFSVESPFQQLKRALVTRFRPGQIFAPAPWELGRIEDLVLSLGLRIRRRVMVMPFLSAETVLVLEKTESLNHLV